MLDYLVRFWKYVSVIWFQLHSAMNQVGRGLINAETRILKVFLTVSIMMQLFQYPFDPFIEKKLNNYFITCESYTGNPMSNARLLIWWEHTTEGAFLFGFTDYKPLLKIHATTPVSFISHSLFDAPLSSHKPPCPSSLSFFFSPSLNFVQPINTCSTNPSLFRVTLIWQQWVEGSWEGRRW